MSRGIDISHHQGAIDWGRVAADDVAFAICKATEGTGFQDARFDANRQGARDNGVPVGGYHFARPGAGDDDAAVEARHHLEHATPGDGDLVPVLDLEVTQLDAQETTRWALLWLDTVEQAIGATPIVLTGPGWAATNLHPDPALGRYPLWIAHHTTKDEPRLPEPWTEWLWWQHSDDGRVDGIEGHVDVNRLATGALPLWATGARASDDP